MKCRFKECIDDCCENEIGLCYLHWCKLRRLQTDSMILFLNELE